MNKNSIFAILLVLVLGLGLWLFVKHVKTGDTITPTATSSMLGSVSPSPAKSMSPTPSASQPAIIITSPKMNEAVDPVITLTGRARVFENQFTVQALDSAGRVMYQAHVMTDAKTAGQYGNYSVEIPISAGNGSVFKLNAFSISPRGDGSFEGAASVTVTLKTTDTINVYTGLLNSNDCSTVTLYPRTVLKSTQFPFLSVVELLKGVAPFEATKGATTQIPSGVQIHTFRQVGTTAYVDFDQALQQGVTGSCRVQAIRSQITHTIKQFLGINNVIVSIDGKTDGILQP